jgi:hypothetical protein
MKKLTICLVSFPFVLLISLTLGINAVCDEIQGEIGPLHKDSRIQEYYLAYDCLNANGSKALLTKITPDKNNNGSFRFKVIKEYCSNIEFKRILGKGENGKLFHYQSIHHVQQNRWSSSINLADDKTEHWIELATKGIHNSGAIATAGNFSLDTVYSYISRQLLRR